MAYCMRASLSSATSQPKAPKFLRASTPPRHHATTPPRHHATTPPRHPVALRHFNTQKIAALPTHPKRPSVFDSFVYVYYAYVVSVAPTSLHSWATPRYELSTSGGFGLTGEGRAYILTHYTTRKFFRNPEKTKLFNFKVLL